MTTLNERLMNDLKEAMKNKDALKKAVLTLLRAGLTAAEKEKKDVLTQEEENVIVLKELKQTKDSIAEAKKVGREDVVTNEQIKLTIIETYLPKMMGEEDIISFLNSKGVQKGTNFGQIMGILMKDNKGKVDGNLAREVIQKHFV